jgi:hypothetical protein
VSERLTHYPELEGSNSATTVTEREKITKNLKEGRDTTFFKEEMSKLNNSSDSEIDFKF